MFSLCNVKQGNSFSFQQEVSNSLDSDAKRRKPNDPEGDSEISEVCTPTPASEVEPKVTSAADESDAVNHSEQSSIKPTEEMSPANAQPDVDEATAQDQVTKRVAQRPTPVHVVELKAAKEYIESTMFDTYVR